MVTYQSNLQQYWKVSMYTQTLYHISMDINTYR